MEFENIINEIKTKRFYRKVNDLIYNIIGSDDHIYGNHHLENDLGCDELDVIEIIMEIEKEFNITVYDDEAERVKTVQHLYDLVYDKTIK